MMFVQIIFWICLFFIFWPYLGYMMTLQIISLLYTKRVKIKDSHPYISFVITVYNEEKRIRQKIENTLSLAYPRDKIEIIVVSDGSTDQTDDIVRTYQNQGVRLLRIPERHGKHFGQGQGIHAARNDLIILTDATTFLQQDSLLKIARNFADPSVGCVSGEDRFMNADSSASGEGLYVKYEMELRGLEGLVGSLVGVSGCFYAVRKKLCSNWIDNMSSDFYIPIIAHMNGFRTVLDRDAIGVYNIPDDPRKEFDRKVRTVVHGLEVLFKFRGILNPFRYGFYAGQMISHKLLRWLVPFFLLLLFVANLLLAEQGLFFLITLLGQILFYLLGIMAVAIRSLRNIAIFKVPLFFIMVNSSIFIAWFYFFTKRDFAAWEPTKR
jgi:cellulose synthase/poly-beta-1,6-N-acetylglucosamine synthase-like glycosyltransferase